MKIVETITPINAEKTILGERDLKLTLDTDTGRVSIKAPAMFGDPVVALSELMEKLELLSQLGERG